MPVSEYWVIEGVVLEQRGHLLAVVLAVDLGAADVRLGHGRRASARIACTTTCSESR